MRERRRGNKKAPPTRDSLSGQSVIGSHIFAGSATILRTMPGDRMNIQCGCTDPSIPIPSKSRRMIACSALNSGSTQVRRGNFTMGM